MTVDHVQVHDTVYTMKLGSIPLIHNGEPVDFLVDHATETIRISSLVPAKRWLAVAGHAVSYAWKSLPPAAPALIPFVGSVE